MFAYVSLVNNRESSKMKIFIIFPLVLATAYCINPELAEIMKTRAKETGLMCMSKVGATEDDIAPLMAHQPAKTATATCFLACVFKTEGFLNADGKIDREGTLAVIEKIKALDEDYYVKIKQVAENCLSMVSESANECDTAAAMHACILTEKTKVGLEHLDID